MRGCLGASLLLLLACANNSSNNGGNDGGMTACTNFGSVCLPTAPTVAARTPCGDVVEYCDKTMVAAPNLACLATPKTPGAGPATVTITGFVHVFSSGPDSNNVSVAVYDAAALAGGANPKSLTPIAQTLVTLDPASQRACDDNSAKGCVIPSATKCMLPRCNDGLGGRTDSQKYCRDQGADGVCSDRLRWEARYTIDGIPTNKQLVIRTAGPNGDANQTWAVIMQWNVYLASDERACEDKLAVDCLDLSEAGKPKYQFNVNALSQSDYVNIPTTAGLSSGISPGMGAVAGEVHDCDNIRVGNVMVGTAPKADRFTYFNGQPLMTLPDSSRFSSGTDRLGLFAALNITPSKVSVQSAGITAAGGAPITFGGFEAWVYADTVSVVNLNGGKPQ